MKSHCVAAADPEIRLPQLILSSLAANGNERVDSQTNDSRSLPPCPLGVAASAANAPVDHLFPHAQCCSGQPALSVRPMTPRISQICRTCAMKCMVTRM